MKYCGVLLLLLSLAIDKSFAQDTVSVQCFTWDNSSRRMNIEFPDDPNVPYRKILMYYNMRCHDAAVGNGNVGCYEWDYSCNTFLTDSSRLDSVAATAPNYIISGYSGLIFYYTTIPTYSYFKYFQKDATYTGIGSETKKTIGAPGQSRSLATANGRFRAQYLYTSQELLSSGFTAGNINGLDLNVSSVPVKLNHLKIKMASVPEEMLDAGMPLQENLTEVYFKDTPFQNTGNHHFQFHNSFNWDGTSSLLIDISYSNSDGSDTPAFVIQNTGNDIQAIETRQQEKSISFDGSIAQLNAGKLNDIQNEITVSFWSFGAAYAQPVNGSFMEGLNASNQRALNLHLPWGNGRIYFDCGYASGSYDRIEKDGMKEDYEGQWVHWAFTKNASTGEMKIYKNGKLWHSGTNKFKPIQLSSLGVGGGLSYSGPYYGRVKYLNIWNKALDEQTIAAWKNKKIEASHPDYANLIFQFDMQDADGSEILDGAPNPQHLSLPISLQRNVERADQTDVAFQNVSEKLFLTLVRGTYTGSSVKMIEVLDSIPNGPRKIQRYKTEDNNLILDSTYYLYYAGEDYIHLENGNNDGTVFIEPEDLIEVSNLNYHRKSPAKFELLSLVTPYGNGLDLGAAGKTFVFDVSDYEPILKGRKTISMEMGGQNQEEIDLKFVFIKGIPERKVLDISNVWPFQRGNFGDILSNKVFEPRTFNLPVPAKHYKLRFTVTGHEQNGEFTPKQHFVNVNGASAQKFPFTVWKECAFNPIYPQGGTWIFDRAGWCPGAASDVHSFNITNIIGNSNTLTLDYGVEPPNLSAANYLVSSQLVSYDEYSHTLDASMEEIIRPNVGRVEFERLNPSCNKPLIRIRNSGKEPLRSVRIRYGILNGTKELYDWRGNLAPSSSEDIELPISSSNFWQAGTDSMNVFEVELLSPNLGTDEYPADNKLRSPFKPVDKYIGNLAFEFRTNNIPQDNHYKIVDKDGNIIFQRAQMNANTTYRDELTLANGCYTLYVEDASHDGLYFWFYASNGSGVARLMRKINTTFLPVKQFNPDFGGGFQYDFLVTGPVSNDDPDLSSLFTISPNPATDQLEVEYQSPVDEQMQWTILSIDSKELKSGILNIQQGKATMKLSLNDLKSGQYIIQLKGRKTVAVQKFIKL